MNPILHVVLSVIGALLGAALLDWTGVVIGVLIGLLGATVLGLSTRVRALEAAIEQRRDIEASTVDVAAARAQPAKAPEVARQTVEVEPELEFDVDLGTQHPEPAPSVTRPDVPARRLAPVFEPRPAAERAEPAHIDREAQPSFGERIASAVKGFFTGGNVVVRTGMIILFFGVAFLLKYAVDRNAFPIEYRLGGISLGALVLFALGWRLRLKQPMYALVLQGGAVGLLYLTVFASAKLYALIPVGGAFLLMVGLVAACGALAVLQDSRALASIGSIGGFLAPVLTATGQGNHVTLFSYYALLNAGILGIAWFKAWRSLNLIGFVFTFLIASAWGVLRYRSEYFYTTEPFLVLFFLFYVAIAVLYAFRQPPRLKGFVDGSLVFGVPIVAFGLQTGLVREFEFGLAYSAVAISAAYLLLAAVLWQLRAEGMRLLTEAFLALGVVFASLAVPFALDGHWTAATWALEGAALVWVGVRQKRVLARNFGLVLQLGAGAAFGIEAESITASMPVINAFFLGAMTVSLGGLFSSFYLYRSKAELCDWERQFHIPMLVWGLLWWFGAGVIEIADHTAERGNNQAVALLCLFSLSVALMTGVQRWLSWSTLRHPPAALLPVAALIALGVIHEGKDMNLLGGWGMVAWPVFFAIQYRVLWLYEDVWKDVLVRIWQLCTLWLAVCLLSSEAAWHLQWTVQLTEAWALAGLGTVPAFILLGLLVWGRHIPWPVVRHQEDIFGAGFAVVSAALLLWIWGGCLVSADPAPLSYTPVLNPLELAQAFAVFVMSRWVWQARRAGLELATRLPAALPGVLLGGTAFLWLNAVVARSVHFWSQTPFNFNSLFGSVSFQAAIAILWSLSALALMAGGARRAVRPIWMAGAVLLGFVILKLFMVDLSGTGTIARIVSFLAVGILMLVIGYLAPLPPKTQHEAS